MYFKPTEKVRSFCSKLCYGAEKHTRFNAEGTGPDMPPLEEICDEGFVNLTQAIIAQAKDDVMQNAPGTPLREDAEAFFLSEEFYGLTNLDGFDMLCRIQDRYDEKQRKKDRRHRQKVRCIETGRVYESPKEAGEAYTITVDSIYKACKSGATAAGMHWASVEDDDNE